ncbi:MAG: c-type cytochrome [Balneolaceae bacterium]
MGYNSDFNTFKIALLTGAVSCLLLACHSSTSKWGTANHLGQSNPLNTYTSVALTNARVTPSWEIIRNQPDTEGLSEDTSPPAQSDESITLSSEVSEGAQLFVLEAFQDTTEEESSQEADQDSIHVLPDFEVQLLYEIPRQSQGSWVMLNKDHRGRLIASDQGSEGMYRIEVGGDPDNPEVDVEELIMPISGAQGLVWAFDHLYANVNGRGLFRLRDSNGNDQLNVMEYMGGSDGGGEHGVHNVIHTEDGEGLYYVAGNHSPLVELTSSRLANWDEDLLLPRRWDARGHARGIFAPGGYIARLNPEATNWELISMGYRNTYDIALNHHGELFAYDSDMEWDMGMPWYRPTRLLHAVSGSDFGWRSGSGKWPEYFEDSLPPLLNIGPGSPTGLVFGYGAEFPARYQRALYALDWTFGTIYAIHLTPEGAGYRAEAEEFLYGNSLPLTSAVIGDDGALYFTTGGRNQDSYLYRVIYRGDESVAPAEVTDNPDAREARELRHRLEEFHGRQSPQAVDYAWPYLNNEDRLIRHAARVAIEAQPTEQWAEKALTDYRPQTRITAIVALARTGSSDYRSDAIEALLELEPATLEPDQQLGLLRAMALVFMRLGDPDPGERTRIADTFQEMLPNDDDRVNTELIRNLVYLRDSRVLAKALDLMQNETPPATPEWGNLLSRNERYGGTIQEMIENPPPSRELNYAFMLRTLRDGWTIEQRREYFTFINEAADRMGGASFSGFLTDMRNDALNTMTESEHEAVADITGVSLKQEPDFEITPPEGPGREWSLDEAVQTVSGEMSDRDFEQGRNAFFATGCASCHRFDGFGGNIGPDLGTVGSRFSTHGLLEKIIDPNVLISDQYSSSRVTLTNGDTVVGLVVERGDEMEIYTRDPDTPPTVIPKDEVRTVEQSDVSTMPPGLINSLNAEELRDLIAYLRSGGDPEDEMFVGEEEEEDSSEEESD